MGKRADMTKENFEFSSGISQGISAVFPVGFSAVFQWIFKAEKGRKFCVFEKLSFYDFSKIKVSNSHL